MRIVRQPVTSGKASYDAADPEIISRFWSKVQIGDGCWLWTASTIKGYGQFRLPRINGRQQVPQYAHRFAWQLTHGAIPKGLNVCHHCDTPLCVRPDHLFLGTQQENLDDARRKGRLVDGRGARKLTNDEYLAILTAPRTRGNGQRIARWFGVHTQTISRIWNGHYVHGPAMPEQGIGENQSGQPKARSASADLLNEILEPVSSVKVRVRGEVR